MKKHTGLQMLYGSGRLSIIEDSAINAANRFASAGLYIDRRAREKIAALKEAAPSRVNWFLIGWCASLAFKAIWDAR